MLAPPAFHSWLLVLGLLLTQAGGARAGTYVQFRTLLGDIGVELMDRDKPATVQNFLRYQTNGYFRNVFLHRCVPGFVLQGGEFITLNRTDPSPFLAESLFGWPDFPPVANEYGVGPTVSNTYGTLAMARLGGQTNSATSQWYFNLADNPGLDTIDGGFTVFGRVVHGTNVLNFFNSLGRDAGVVDLRDWFPGTTFGDLFKELPVRYTGHFYPRISDLLYVDITLLRVSIRRDAQGRPLIRWNSVAGRTNRVEYTDGFPPDWQGLLVTNGTGGFLEATDTESAPPSRFYRVRVD